LDARPLLDTRDKGKKTYPAWYAYARTQGLNFHGIKLLTPTFSALPRFLYQPHTDSLFCNGYGVYLKAPPPAIYAELTLKALIKILNSSLMNYYVHQTSVSLQGGYPCYQKNFISKFGIPVFTTDEITLLEKSTQAKCNTFLYKKYALSGLIK
jgi:hypothetical protein